MKEDRDPIKPLSFQFEPEVHIESVEERATMPFAETRYSRYLNANPSCRMPPRPPVYTVCSMLSGSTLAIPMTCERRS